MSVTIDQDAKKKTKREDVYSPHSGGSIGHFKGPSTRYVSDLDDRAIIEGRKSDSDSKSSRKGRIAKQRRQHGDPSQGSRLAIHEEVPQEENDSFGSDPSLKEDSKSEAKTDMRHTIVQGKPTQAE